MTFTVEVEPYHPDMLVEHQLLRSKLLDMTVCTGCGALMTGLPLGPCNGKWELVSWYKTVDRKKHLIKRYFRPLGSSAILCTLGDEVSKPKWNKKEKYYKTRGRATREWVKK